MRDPTKDATKEAKGILRKIYHSCINRVVDPRRDALTWDKPDPRTKQSAMYKAPMLPGKQHLKKIEGGKKKKRVVPIGADDPNTMKTIQAARDLRNDIAAKLGIPVARLPGNVPATNRLPDQDSKPKEPSAGKRNVREENASALAGILDQENERRVAELGAWRQMLDLQEDSKHRWDELKGADDDEGYGELGTAFAELDNALGDITLRPLDEAERQAKREKKEAAEAAAALAGEAAARPKKLNKDRLARMAEPREVRAKKIDAPDWVEGRVGTQSSKRLETQSPPRGKNVRAVAGRYNVDAQKLEGLERKRAGRLGRPEKPISQVRSVLRGVPRYEPPIALRDSLDVPAAADPP